MSNQLTPMQWMEEQLKMILPINQMNDIVMQDLLTQAKEKEQQVIEDAYWDGGQDIPLTDAKCKEYYNTKFKQNGK